VLFDVFDHNSSSVFGYFDGFFCKISAFFKFLSIFLTFLSFEKKGQKA